MSVLDRIKKLVALAGSPNENEARNAAVQVCKLIIEHKIVLQMPTSEPRHQGIPNTRPPRPTETSDEVMRNNQPLDDLFNFAKRTRERVDDFTSRGEPPYVITAPQEGTCRDCGEQYQRGDRIWYRRGVGAVHTMKCDPDKLQPVRPAPR